jgi:hypothetical protein
MRIACSPRNLTKKLPALASGLFNGLHNLQKGMSKTYVVSPVGQSLAVSPESAAIAPVSAARRDRFVIVRLVAMAIS